MPYVEATGAKLYFEESGYGYPIIFIHEFASDIRGWEAQVRYFSRSYRCIAYNARGYPPSDVPEDASLYRWQFAVDDIAAIMRDLKIERAHLVGLSMGGYAALQFGLRYPEKTSAMVAASVGSGSHPSHRDAQGDGFGVVGHRRIKARRSAQGNPAGTRPAMFPMMRLCMAGSSRSTISPF